MGLIDNRNESLEEKLGSKLLVYFTADSPIVGGMVAEDAIIPMFDHLRAIGKQDNSVPV